MSDSDQPLGLGCSEGFGTTPRWWHCDTHGPGNRTAWGCPECVREMRASLGRARGLLVELDSVLRMAESHNGGALTAAHVRAAVEPYLPLDLAKETNLWRCTVCGRIGTVGRCCGEETREPVRAPNWSYLHL